MFLGTIFYFLEQKKLKTCLVRMMFLFSSVFHILKTQFSKSKLKVFSPVFLHYLEKNKRWLFSVFPEGCSLCSCASLSQLDVKLLDLKMC